MLRWKLGTMAPGGSKEIKLKLFPKDDGEFVNVARVTFEHGQRVSTVIDKPRVALKREAPQYAHENDRIPVKLIVQNTGRAAVTNLVVEDRGARTGFLTTRGFRDTLIIAGMGRDRIGMDLRASRARPCPGPPRK